MYIFYIYNIYIVTSGMVLDFVNVISEGRMGGDVVIAWKLRVSISVFITRQGNRENLSRVGRS